MLMLFYAQEIGFAFCKFEAQSTKFETILKFKFSKFKTVWNIWI